MRTINRISKPILIYFLVYFVCYSLIAFTINQFTYPTQGVNDDEFFAQLVSGEFTGQSESFTHISPASPQWSFGFVLTKFYLFNSSLSWYYLILLLTVLISITYMTIIISRNFWSFTPERIFIIILSILYLLWFVPAPTYTSTAFISSLAGIFGFIAGCKNKLSNIHFIMSSILLTWGMSIRTESFYATGLFFVPVIFLSAVLSRKDKKVFLRKVLIVLALPLIVYSFNRIMDEVNFAQSEWKEYKIFNESRYAIQDNEAERVIAENPMDFGWTKTEYRLFDSYNFISVESFSGEKLKLIYELYETRSSLKTEVNFEVLTKRWTTYFAPFYSIIYSSLFIILFFTLFFLRRKEQNTAIKLIVMSILSLIFNFFLIIAITILLRLPERIVFPLSFFFPVMIILIASILRNEIDSYGINTKRFLSKFFIPVVYSFLLWPTINHLYSLKINPAYTSFWGEQKQFFQETAQDKILIGNASQFKSIWSNPYYLKDKKHNLSIYPLGWYTFSPYWIQRGKLLGINNIAIGNELLVNSNLLWISDDIIAKDVIDLISEQNSIDVEFKKLNSKSFDYGEYNIYSIVKKR
jgi:hypothetical protein